MNKRKIGMILVILVGLLLLAAFVVVYVFFSSSDRAVLTASTKQFEHGGVNRTYLQYTPKKVEPDTKIVVGLHGFSGNARQFAYYTALHNALPGAVIVYPNARTPEESGVKSGWNSGFCCGSGWVSKTDDVGFIDALVSSVAQDLGIDAQQFYATGFSNGGFMTQRLATDIPERIAAAVSVSGVIGTQTTQLSPQTAVPILHMHGEQDRLVTFNGGVSSDPDFAWQSFNDTVRTWEDVNSVTGTETKSIAYPQLGHSWKGWRIANVWQRSPEASQEVASFFGRY